MVLTVPGQKDRKPRSTPMTPFEHDAASTSWPAIQAPTGRRTRVQPVRAHFRAEAIAAREDHRTGRGRNRGPVLQALRSRCLLVSGSPNERAWCATAPS